MWIIVVTFLAFFLTSAMVIAVITERSKEAKQTHSRLASLAAPQGGTATEDVLTVRREERLSAVPWVDSLLRRLDVSDHLRLTLYQAELKWTVGRLLLMSVLLAVITGAMIELRTGTLPLAFILGAVAACAPYFYVLNRRSRRFDRMRQYLPEALDLMVAAIRAGHSFSSAMSMAAQECPEPIRREFRQCYEEQNFGLDLRASLMNLAYRVPIHDIRILVTAVLIQNETGGNLTEILDKVAYLIREDFRLQRQVKVHTAQGRLTGWILSALPPVLGLLLYTVSPDQMSLLWKRSMGQKMLIASVLMTITGTLIIRKIVRIRV